MPTNLIDAAGFRKLVAGKPADLGGVVVALDGVTFQTMRDAIDAAGLMRGVCTECDGPLAEIECLPPVKSCLSCGLDFPETLLRPTNDKPG